jgi:cytochrome c oxidase cbb3-type subunit I/II
MEDPRAISVGSNMPAYPWLLRNDTDVAALPSKLSVQRTLGVPYPNWTPGQIRSRVDEQAKSIAADLRAAGAYVAPEREIVALIAYLQVLGRSESVAAPKPAVGAGQ